MRSILHEDVHSIRLSSQLIKFQINIRSVLQILRGVFSLRTYFLFTSRCRSKGEPFDSRFEWS
jgi:hypothetical protein